MGLISAGDEHNRRGNEVLAGVDNVRKVVEVVLFYNADWATHVQRVRDVLRRCAENGIMIHITKNAPYSWGNSYACAITRCQKPQQLGRVRRARQSSIITCVALVSRAGSQRAALLQAAAETTASGSTGKEDLKADRRVRHYKEVGLQEWPLAGRATVQRVLYGISLCMFLRRRTILSKCLRAPASVDLTIHNFRTVDRIRTAGHRFVVVAQFGKR